MFFLQLFPLCASVVVFFVAIPSYGYALSDIKQSYAVFYTNEQRAEKAKTDGKSSVTMLGMPPTSNNYNIYNGESYLSQGNSSKIWANAWIAKFYGLKSVTVDNSLPLVEMSQRDLPLIDIILTNYQRIFGGLEHRLLHNAFSDYTVSNSKNVSSKYGKNPISSDSNLPADKPWLRNALIRYINVDTDEIVGVEQITSPYNEAYDISNAAISGYNTLPNQPKSYTFTTAKIQNINIKVAPRTQTIAVYLKNSQNDTVKAYNITAQTGQLITLNAPQGYLINGKSNTHFTMPTVVNNVKNITVTSHSAFKRIELFAILIVIGLFIVLPKLFIKDSKST